jgi:hypothetical protein
VVANEPLLHSLGLSSTACNDTRGKKIRAVPDGDGTRGDRDRVMFAAALVADYLAVSWAPAFLEPLARRHTHTRTHTCFLEPLAHILRCVMPATWLQDYFGKGSLTNFG